MLQFEKKYFDGEVRDEFYIEPMMKSAWAAQLEVLQKIDKLCKEHSIKYFADWGTLLGAVRHKGIIPWDDDIDICMMRADLERFLQVLEHSQNELQYLNIYNDPGWGAHATKVVNSTSFITDRKKLREYHGFAFTAGVDIFIIDYVPRDKELEKEQYEVLDTIAQACHLKQEMEEYPKTSEQYLKGVIMLREFLDIIQKKCQITFSQDNPTEQELYILFEEVSALYGDEDSDYLTQVACLGVGMDYYISKEAYASVIYMPFENMMIPVPIGYEELLRKKYGPDYMVPQNKGAGHDYPFYGRLIEALARIKMDGDVDATKKYINQVAVQYHIDFLNRQTEPSINYTDEYFESEVIDKIQVSEERKHIWAAQAEILEEIKRICHLHNLKVFAIGNTLRETVKYKNYGPNSEDIHLGMTREDYIKFINVLPTELGVWFDYSNVYTNPEHEDMRCYIMTDGFFEDKEKYLARFCGCPHIVGIDISAMDAIEDNEERANIRETLVRGLYTTALNVNTTAPYSDAELSIVEEWERSTKIQINLNGNLRNEFFKSADCMAGAYRGESKFICNFSDIQTGNISLQEREWFDKTVELPFGCTTIPVPVGYENML